MRRLSQSLAYTVVFKAFLASDGRTPATGKTIAMQISKNGGAFANIAAGATNATEIASGWYKLALAVGDTDTKGDLVVRGTESSIDPTEQIMQVVDDVSNLTKTVQAIARGTASGTPTTTSIPTSAFTPAGAVADQFKNRTVLFDKDTTTATLRGAVASITASSNAATPTLTVSALPAAPVSGDTFSVV